MIDIQDPKSIIYSEEEKEKMKLHFILLLHTLLLVYLGVHNLFIPVITNGLRGEALLQEVHYWFLFHLPVQYFLRKKESIPFSYLLFLVVGSLFRLCLELGLSTNLKSWSTLSVLVSELSSCIFYFVYWPIPKKRHFSAAPLLSLLIIPALMSLEIHSTKDFIRASQEKKRTNALVTLGCQGSEMAISFPLISGQSISSLSVGSCGFPRKTAFVDSSFRIKNETPQGQNLRLYKLHVLHGKVSWRFVRLVHLKTQESWDLTSVIKSEVAYLIKSPDRRSLGQLVLIPKGTKDFPLGKGILELEYDSLKWTPHE